MVGSSNIFKPFKSTISLSLNLLVVAVHSIRPIPLLILIWSASNDAGSDSVFHNYWEIELYSFIYAKCYTYYNNLWRDKNATIYEKREQIRKQGIETANYASTTKLIPF